MRVLEFWQRGCPYCAAQKKAKLMERLAGLHPDISFERVDCGVRADLADALSVRELPSYLAVEGDQVLARLSGGVPLEQLEQLVQKARKKSKPGARKS